MKDLSKKYYTQLLELIDSGKYEEARVVGTRLISRLDEFDQNEELEILNLIAIAYQKLGQLSNAANLLEGAFNSIDIDDNKIDKEILYVTLSNLSRIYKSLGRYSDASEILERILNDDDFVEISAEKDNWALMSNLAAIYSDMGDYHKSIHLLESIVDSAIENLDENDSSLLIYRSNLAMSYAQVDKLSYAKDIIEGILEKYINKFGPKHPSTISDIIMPSS